MALDRVVRWKDLQPTHEHIQTLIEDFFGDAARVTWEGDRWFCVLPGSPSEPFRRLRDDVVTLGSQVGMASERWIEVWPNANFVYVMTRHADRYTNALAEELAQLITFGWKGEREPM